MTRARDLASLGDNSSKLEQQGLVQIVASSVTPAGGSSSGSVDSKGNVTFSTCTSININGVFSSSYTNYIVIGEVSSSGGTWVGIRYRNDSGDRTSGYLGSSWYLGLSSADFAKDTNITTYAPVTYCATTDSTFQSIIYRPFATARTYQYTAAIRGDAYMVNCGSYTDTTISYTGFTIYPVTTGTLSGTIRVYGYNQ